MSYILSWKLKLDLEVKKKKMTKIDRITPEIFHQITKCRYI